MKLVSVEEMRELDRKTIEGLGLSGLILMENAGKGVADAVIDNYADEIKKIF